MPHRLRLGRSVGRRAQPLKRLALKRLALSVALLGAWACSSDAPDSRASLDAAPDAGAPLAMDPDLGRVAPDLGPQLDAWAFDLGADHGLDRADLGSDADASSDQDQAAELTPPPGLVRHLIGSDQDAQVTPRGPAWILMGGGPDVDEAFLWWRDKIAGGDVVVLRTSGGDGYQDYLFGQIGGADSVETLLVTSRELADDPYVAQRVAQAEGVFIAGGDQATYLRAWRDTALSRALQTASARGAVLGGTSAGAMVLGQLIFSAQRGSITSSDALRDPYHPHATFERALVPSSPLLDTLVDTHFYERDRLGRLVAFAARMRQDGLATRPLGLGLDEQTALVIDDSGLATVLGRGYVYVLDAAAFPERCEPDQALEISSMPYYRLGAGHQVTLPALSWPIPPQAPPPDQSQDPAPDAPQARQLRAAQGRVEALRGRLY